jgi:hypothetical protein
MKEVNKSKELNNTDKKLYSSDIISSYKNKFTRPLKFGELCIILARFQIMLETEPNRYTIEEFIRQEDWRRDMFL